MRTLMLSDEAKASPLPVLEIENEDVSCSHAASAGRIGEEELFYATSRGLTPEDARTAIAHGHVQPILDDIRDKDMRTWISIRISKRLEGETSSHVPNKHNVA